MPYKSSIDRNAAQKLRYERYKINSPFKHKCARANTRAKYLKVDFDLTPEYLESIWTGTCPVFNIPINISGNRVDEFVAELDRFIPAEGYVKGNVAFLSRRANRLKNNVTSVELRQLIDWMTANED